MHRRPARRRPGSSPVAARHALRADTRRRRSRSGPGAYLWLPVYHSDQPGQPRHGCDARAARDPRVHAQRARYDKSAEPHRVVDRPGSAALAAARYQVRPRHGSRCRCDGREPPGVRWQRVVDRGVPRCRVSGRLRYRRGRREHARGARRVHTRSRLRLPPGSRPRRSPVRGGLPGMASCGVRCGPSPDQARRRPPARRRAARHRGPRAAERTLRSAVRSGQRSTAARGRPGRGRGAARPVPPH
jgi:hypothetical protein